MDKILKVAKRLKTFTLEDIVMFCEIDVKTTERFLRESENIKPCGDQFKYIEVAKSEDKLLIKIFCVKIQILQLLPLAKCF